MKYFLDLGGNDSCSAKIWRKMYDPKAEYKIYTFEPEPDFEQYYQTIENHVLIPSGVWIEDGLMHFYQDILDSRKAGGSMMQDKFSSNLDKEHPITISTVDFSQWLIHNFNMNDEVIVKMDIEGAEYQVIPKMFDDNTLQYIDKLMIEWHWKKLKGFQKELHNECVKMVSSIPQQTWPGVEQAERILGKGYRNK